VESIKLKNLCWVGVLAASFGFGQGSFDADWKRFTHTLSKPDLYRLLWDLPKGGDLHNHHEYSIPMTFWLAGAAQRGYLTRARPGCGETLQWTVLRSDSVQKLAARVRPLAHRKYPWSGD
jgi:hypothetical protein